MIVEKSIDDVEIGQSAELSRTVAESDIQSFAAVTGDTNPVHLNADYAAGTMFKSRIAHGMLSAGYISAVIGTRLPGPGAIYLSQSLKFKAPVRIGDTVVTTCTITAKDAARRRITLLTQCRVGETVVVEGEAMIMLPAAP